MKKTIALFVVLVLVFALAACSDNSGTQSSTPSPSSEETQTPPMDSVTTPDTQPADEVEQGEHLSTEFAVSTDDGKNQLLYAVHIFFDGLRPKITKEDVTNVVMTKDGQPVPLDFNVMSANRGETAETAKTTYEIIFTPSFSVPTTGSGTYSFTCKILGVEYSTGDYYFNWNSGGGELTPSDPSTSQGQGQTAPYPGTTSDPDQSSGNTSSSGMTLFEAFADAGIEVPSEISAKGDKTSYMLIIYSSQTEVLAFDGETLVYQATIKNDSCNIMEVNMPNEKQGQINQAESHRSVGATVYIGD